MRSMKLEHHDRDQNGDDAVAECFETRLTHEKHGALLARRGYTQRSLPLLMLGREARLRGGEIRARSRCLRLSSAAFGLCEECLCDSLEARRFSRGRLR